MISKTTAIKVLNEALKTGADFAEIYVEQDEATSISMDNRKVETCNDTLTFGAGIRLLKDLQSVYGYTNDVTLKGLLALAENTFLRRTADIRQEDLQTENRQEKQTSDRI